MCPGGRSPYESSSADTVQQTAFKALASGDWLAGIDKALHQAAYTGLFVDSDVLDSRFITEIELPKLLDAAAPLPGGPVAAPILAIAHALRLLESIRTTATPMSFSTIFIAFVIENVCM